MRFTDTTKSLAYQQTALIIAKKENKAEEISISYALLSLFYKKKFQTNKAQLYADSSYYLAAQLKSSRAMGYAYMATGLLNSFFSETDQAINQLILAYQNFRQPGDYANMARVASEISNLYADKDAVKQKKYVTLALNAAAKTNSEDEKLYVRLSYGNFLIAEKRKNPFLSADTAVNYFKETIRQIEKHPDQIYTKSNMAVPYLNLAVLYFENPFPGSEPLFLQQLDQALVIARQYNIRNVYRNSLGLKGEYYIQKKDYTTAGRLFKEGIAYQEAMPYHDYYTLSQFYAAMKKLAILQQDYKSYELYDRGFMKYNAFEYNEATAKALQNADVRFESSQKAKMIKTLEKENKLQRSNKWFGYGTAFLLAIGLLFMFRSYYFRQKYYIQNETIFRDQQKNAELRLQLEKLQTAAATSEKLSIERRLLQSQINPHFVFNALGNIQSFILQNDTRNAVLYLAKFSKLMRQILEFTTREFIPLKDEIDSLRNYIELQQLRLNNSFDYTIIDQGIEAGISIPPMLIQPFVENAIEHGLKPLPATKRGDLQLAFSLTENNTYISCTLTDNGVGINFSMSNKVKNKLEYQHRSMGTLITKERLTSEGSIYGFSIDEMKNDQGQISGTTAVIKIPFIKV
ncbi:hypothetical protein HDE70_000965 [Pedobacter cryoconitis]|nr:hypothetical protein [Pedobacter cryoconitis]